MVSKNICIRGIALQVHDVLDLIGNTPMIDLKKATGYSIYGKAEFLYPGGSVKDRIAKYMIEEAERNGVLKKGMKIIEPTSGNTGIGLALARMLRDEGHELTLVARRPEPLEEAARELGAVADPANLADVAECNRIVAAHAERFGGMDVLVNSAGLGIGGSFASQETKAIQLQLDVNLRATMIVTRESLPLLRATRACRRR